MKSQNAQHGATSTAGSMSRALTIVLCAVGAHASSYSSLDDADAYLVANGFPAGLPQLNVKYKLNDWGEVRRIEGGTEELAAPADIPGVPVVTWYPENAGPHPDKHILMMIDPDEPEPHPSGDLSQSGHAGPLLLWLMVNCEDTVKSCTEMIKYLEPMPGSGRHRYIFVLLKQIRPPAMSLVEEYFVMQNRERWRLKDFMEAAKEYVEPVAVNFFYASKDGASSATEVYHPEEDDTPKMKPPEVEGPAPAPSATPLGPAWNVKVKVHGPGDEHDEL